MFGLEKNQTNLNFTFSLCINNFGQWRKGIGFGALIA
jgi:hypothetical protein